MGRQLALTVRTRGSGFFLILRTTLNLFCPVQQGAKLTASDSLNHKQLSVAPNHPVLRGLS